MEGAVLDYRPRLDFAATQEAVLVERVLAELSTVRQELSQMRQQVGYYKAMHQRALTRLAQKDAQIDQLTARVRQLESEQFGRRSEKASGTDRANTLPGEHEESSDGTTHKRKRGQQKDRPGPQRRKHDQLPVVEEFVELTAEQATCPQCGEPVIPNGTENSEQIEVEVRAYRRRIRRRRGQRTCSCSGPRTVVAPTPPKLIPKGTLGTSVWVELLLGKFLYHQPVERQLAAWRRRGLDLSPGTIAHGLQRLEPMLTPLYDALLARATATGFAQADETRWLMFIEQLGKKGHRWWMWAFLTAEVAAFRLDPTRSHDVPEKHFASRAGPADQPLVLMVDRYSGYKAMESVHDGQIVLAFCWAHVRRDFIRVGKGWKELLPWAVAWVRRIRQLYDCQRQRRSHVDDTASFAAADANLRACLNHLCDQATAELAQAKLREPCRKVLTSLQAHWTGLTRFADDLRIPLDNNAAERVQRGPAVGRKNYYGSGSLWSGHLAAKMFSLLATLKLHGLNERQWMTWYLHHCARHGGQAPSDIQPFLPWNLTPEQRHHFALKPKT